MENEDFAKLIDWNTTSTGNALLDATISTYLDANASYEVAQVRETRGGGYSSKEIIGTRTVNLSGWLAAHVSAANATKYLAEYRPTRYNTFSIMDGSNSKHFPVKKEKTYTINGSEYEAYDTFIPGPYPTSSQNVGFHVRNFDRTFDGRYNETGTAPVAVQVFLSINPAVGVANGVP